MLGVLSLLAEIVRQHLSTRIPFSRKAILCLVTFDIGIISGLVGEKVMAILATLLANQAKQAKLMIRLNVHQEIRLALIQLLAQVRTPTTMRLLLHALREVSITTKLAVSSEELRELGVEGDCGGSWVSRGGGVAEPPEAATKGLEKDTLGPRFGEKHMISNYFRLL